MATKVPFSCKETKIFVVDTSKLEHIDDIRSRELGAIKNERVQRDYVLVVEDKKVIKVLKKNPNVMRKDNLHAEKVLLLFERRHKF